MLDRIAPIYEGNSKSKVPYFIPTERIPELSWQAWVQLVQIFTTLGKTRIVDQRTRSSSFARQCSTSQCCRNHELLGLGNFPHPPYSPYLAPSDSHLFPTMKKHLKDQLLLVGYSGRNK
jgi:hypothetical protein